MSTPRDIPVCFYCHKPSPLPPEQPVEHDCCRRAQAVLAKRYAEPEPQRELFA